MPDFAGGGVDAGASAGVVVSARSPRSMVAPARPETLVRFGEFELNRATGELRRHDLRVSLPEQPLRLLEVLVEHPGVVVSREQLRERLWAADTFVDFEHGLNAAVKRLRDALGDAANAPRFIETVPRRGYRFVASIEPPGAPVGDLRAPWTHRRTLVAISAVAVLMLVTGLLSWRRWGAQESSPSASQPQADSPDVRPGVADRRHVVTGRAVHRIRVRQVGQLRHLDPACRHGHGGADHQIALSGLAASVVTGRQRDRVPVRAGWRRTIRCAGVGRGLDVVERMASTSNVMPDSGWSGRVRTRNGVSWRDRALGGTPHATSCGRPARRAGLTGGHPPVARRHDRFEGKVVRTS